MPSHQVIEKLEKLQTELETVSVAINHIEDASKVAKTSADILKKIPELLIELKSLEEKHRNVLQKDLKEKIDSIEKQLQLLLNELKEKAKQLSQVIEETKKLEKAFNDYFVELRKINFPERLDKIDNQISSINIGIGNLQSVIQNSQTKIEAVSSSLIEGKQSIEKKQIENHELSLLLLQRINHQDKVLNLLKTILIVIGGLVIIGLFLTILQIKTFK
jgi:chromosome segregation ATPase